MKISTKQILVGAALLVLPGASVALGGYLIYKGIKRRNRPPKSFSEILEDLVKQANETDMQKTPNVQGTKLEVERLETDEDGQAPGV